MTETVQSGTWTYITFPWSGRLTFMDVTMQSARLTLIVSDTAVRQVDSDDRDTAVR